MPRRVSFSLLYTFENPPEWELPWDRLYGSLLEQIEWVDRDLDIDRIELSEHHFFEDGYLSTPMDMAAVVAAKTSRVGVGINLIQLPLNNAVRLAEQSLFVDALSGGRFRLGVGMGYYQPEFAGLGTNVRHRVGRTEEGIAVLRNAFSGEPFAFHGRHYDFDELRVTPWPVRPGGPQIWVGAAVPAAIDRAARLGDGYLAFDTTTFAHYFAACDALGVPIQQQRANATYWFIVAEDPERAFAHAGEHFMHLINGYIMRGVYSDRDIPLTEPYTRPADALADGHITLVDAAGAIQKLNADVTRGVIDFSLLMNMPGEPADQVAERIQYFNDNVLPHVEQSSHPALTTV